MDLSQLSDADLMSAAGIKPPVDLSQVPDEHLMQIAGIQPAGISLSSPKGVFNSFPTGQIQNQPGITIGDQTPDINQAVASFPQQVDVPSGFNKYNAIERGAGNAVLGLTQLLNTGNQNIDQNLLAQTIANSNQAGVGTGVGGAVGEAVGDPRNWMLGLIPAAKMASLPVRAAAGGLYGLTEGSESPDTGQQIQDRLTNAGTNATMFAGLPIVLNKAAEAAPTISQFIKDAASTVRANLPENYNPEAGFLSNQASGAAPRLAPAIEASPLEGVNKGTTFASNPNPLQVGLEANKAISQAFDEAKTTFGQARKAVVDSGVQVPAGDFIPKINNIVGYLSNKIGEKGDTTALSKLQDIADKINTGSAIDYGTGMKNTNIKVGDLIDFREALNSAISDNKFLNKGDNTLISAKSYVDNLLARAGEIDPSVTPKIQAYKDAAQDIAKRFTGNKALRPFWQPNDYTAWKANINNPEAIGHNDTTLTRANQFLDNLNTNKAGSVTAVINALGPEKGKEVLRAAYVRANKANPNIYKTAAGAIIKAPLNPLGAGRDVISAFAKKPENPPINELLKNFKKTGIK